MKKVSVSFFFLIIIFILSFFYILNNNQKPLIYEEKYYKFGTLVSIKISESANKSKEEIKTIFDKVANLLDELHIKWHPWEENPKNILYNLNKALQNGNSYKVDNDTLNIIKTSKYVAKITNNLFNPLNGKLYEIWGFHKEDFSKNKVPDQKIIDKIVSAKLTMDNIKIDKNIISTNIKDPKIRKLIKLDFNAIAKGQIILNIKALLRSNNIENALINIGGDIYAMGYRDSKNKTNWTSAIFNPDDNNKPIKIIKLKPNTAIATSGNYFRNFKIDNNNYHHIINGFNGKPNNKIKQATVIDDNPLIADALTTTILLSDKFSKKMNKSKYYIL